MCIRDSPGAQHCTGPHLPNGASPGDGLVAPRGYGGLDKWGGSPCARGLEVFYDEATALVALPHGPWGPWGAKRIRRGGALRKLRRATPGSRGEERRPPEQVKGYNESQ